MTKDNKSKVLSARVPLIISKQFENELKTSKLTQTQLLTSILLKHYGYRYVPEKIERIK